ncbi:hypothetical protein HMPREF1608_04285 [Escherichia coli 908525]|nr:hypothetical protein HMPREF1588_02729 [Escherichia coli 110957]ESD65797.1 hypothetical protein HMPREF1608_04285 [Escherichia coli 908525]
MNGLRNTFLRIYLCIFNRMKKTVNRSSKYIFLLFKTDPSVAQICSLRQFPHKPSV